MKSLKVLSALFLSSALLTTACTPQDKEVGPPELMAKIPKPKGTKKKPDIKQTSNPNAFDFGSFSAASVMMEKQIEAVEMLQIVLGNTDITKTLYTLTEGETKDGNKYLSLKSIKDETKFSNKLGEITGTVDKDFKVAVVLPSEGNKVVGAAPKEVLAMVGKNIYMNNGSGDAKVRSFLNTFEVYDMKVSKVPGDDSLLIVRIDTEGNFNYRAGKGYQKQDFNYQSTFYVDVASLKESQVKIFDSSMFLDLGSKRFNVKADEFSVKVEGRCSEINGAAKINMGKGKTTEITFGQELIKITDKDWEQKIATCGQRPTVDVMRLLVY
ncbi:hypothetical protein [Bdellovibrio sp. GT3]|uniref:hypothetical protein n=1 Tax=Bdellovibrio sp. GT3 TaxID=3136282 RepID=UPI0030EFFEC2